MQRVRLLLTGCLFLVLKSITFIVLNRPQVVLLVRMNVFPLKLTLITLELYHLLRVA